MSLRRLLNCVHGILLDGCADEDERDALEERLNTEPASEPQMTWEARIAAAGGEVALAGAPGPPRGLSVDQGA